MEKNHLDSVTCHTKTQIARKTYRARVEDHKEISHLSTRLTTKAYPSSANSAGWRPCCDDIRSEEFISNEIEDHKTRTSVVQPGYYYATTGPSRKEEASLEDGKDSEAPRVFEDASRNDLGVPRKRSRYGSVWREKPVLTPSRPLFAPSTNDLTIRE